MNKSRIVRLALFLFVGVSVLWLVKEYNNQPAASQTEIAESAPITEAVSPQVAVYYFHGTNRCQTCLKIEALSEQAMKTSFASELSDGRITWQVLNYELPENKKYVDDYQLYSQSLIVLKFADGKRVEWKNLTDIWELVGDDAAFEDYVRREVNAYLGEA